MPHQFMAIDCEKCGYSYCPICKDKCPQCGEIDITDEKTMQTRKQMKEHMNRNKKTEDKKRYFAYGSNMDGKQILERCPKSNKIGQASISGFEFFINKRGVASISKKEGKKVWGIIYAITESDETSLDKCEGYPKVYGKEKLPELNAFCYIDPIKEKGLPRDGYLEKIIKAAQLNSFPKEYIAELKSWFN